MGLSESFSARRRARWFGLCEAGTTPFNASSEGGYPLGAMIRINLLLHRLPFPLLIVFLIVAALLFGFACALMTEHPGQAVDRAVSLFTALPAELAVWAGFAAVLAAASRLTIAGVADAHGRASPAALQRFLF